MDNFKTITFTTDKLSMNVIIKDNTAWLSTYELKQLFGVSQPTLSRYIKSTYNELKAVMNNSANEIFKTENLICQNGDSKSNRKVIHYNLSFALELEKKLNSGTLESLKELVENSDNSTTPFESKDVITYSNGAINIDVSVSPKEETVWLTQSQIAKLFDTTQQNVSKHIINIFEDCELAKDSVHKEYLYTASDNKQYLTSIYNLDLILAVGYRIKSKRAAEFRKWVSEVLKQYIIKGYSYNEERLSSFSDSIIRLENRVYDVKKQLDDLKMRLGVEKETIFVDGEYYDAFIFVKKMLKEANDSIVVIDPYFDNEALSYFRGIDKKISKKIYLSHIDLLKKKVFESFKEKYGDIGLYSISSIHDRYIIIDNEKLYLLGTSLNSVGKSIFTGVQIENKQILQVILKKLKEGHKIYSD